jgi:Na+/H+ antiporter NhaC
MRNKKKAIVIIIMMGCVVFIQCAKTFEKVDEHGAVEEQQTGIEKNKSLVAQGKKYFASTLLVMRISGVGYFILTKLYLE